MDVPRKTVNSNSFVFSWEYICVEAAKLFHAQRVYTNGEYFRAERSLQGIAEQEIAPDTQQPSPGGAPSNESNHRS